MALELLRPAKGATKRRRRVARGIGSGMGKTATRGTKGQKARRQIRPGFEGGQTPIHRRLPVKKGFRNVNHKEHAIVNLDDLQRLVDDKKITTITPEVLMEQGLIGSIQDGLKVLAFGDITKAVKVTAHHFSAAAKEKIEKAGGTAKIIEFVRPSKLKPEANKKVIKPSTAKGLAKEAKEAKPKAAAAPKAAKTKAAKPKADKA